jgi:hypothetical protein
MPNIGFMIQASRRVVGSAAQRRELRAYLRFLRSKRWSVTSREAYRLINARSANGDLPPRFSLAPPTAGDHDSCPINLPVPRNKSGEQAASSQAVSIDLAGRTVSGHTAPWKHQFDDPESAFAAHRFGWILPLLARASTADLVLHLGRLAADWVHEHKFLPGADGWDSYSVSERIVNWVFLASKFENLHSADGNLYATLSSNIDQHAEVLRHRLEFRGASTNNHLLNNGRALYFAGVFLGKEALQDLGRQILRYGLAEMFTPSGFLREGSSHYHILLCRTYLETWYYAHRSGDARFSEQLKDQVEDQLQCAAFLQQNSSLPLIGDVSPDSPPEFHRGLTVVGQTLLGSELPAMRLPDAGWHSLFGVDHSPEAVSSSPVSRRVTIFADAGYYGVDWWPVKLVIYVNPLGYVPGWSHGHADLGGFVLEWEGRALFVDCGRSTYQANALGRYGRSVRSHNAISIDRYEPCVVHAHNGFVPPMLPEYCGRPPAVQIEEERDLVRITVTYFGFERLQADLRVTRIFEISCGRIELKDLIEGRRRHRVETFFHLHPSVAVSETDQNRVQLHMGETRPNLTAKGDETVKPEVIRGRAGAEPAGWFSPRFGVCVPTTTLAYRYHRLLPLRNSYIIEAA